MGGGLLSLSLVWTAARAAAPTVNEELAAAQVLLSAKNYAEARSAYERILTRAPTNPEANYQLGLMAADAGDWARALRCEAMAVKGAPDDARYQDAWGEANATAAQKANVFSKLSYARQCLVGFQRAVQLDPANLDYRRSLFDFYLEAPAFVGGGQAKARAEAEAIGRLDPESGREELTRLYVAEGKYEQALQLYDVALRQSSTDSQTLYRFGQLALLANQRLDEGIAAFQRCLELPRPRGNGVPSAAVIHVGIGTAWEKKHQPDKARAEYRAALKEQPELSAAKLALDRLTRNSP